MRSIEIIKAVRSSFESESRPTLRDVANYLETQGILRRGVHGWEGVIDTFPDAYAEVVVRDAVQHFSPPEEINLALAVTLNAVEIGILTDLREATKDDPDARVLLTPLNIGGAVERRSAFDRLVDLGLVQVNIEYYTGRLTLLGQLALAAMPGVAAAAAEEPEEKTEFDVVLTQIGPNRIAVIKAVQALLDTNLTLAKDIVDSSYRVVLYRVDRETSEDAKAKLEAEGAKVEIK